MNPFKYTNFSMCKVYFNSFDFYLKLSIFRVGVFFHHSRRDSITLSETHSPEWTGTRRTGIGENPKDRREGDEEEPKI